MTEKAPYQIRWARGEDWENAMDLVWRTFLKFEACDYTEEGVLDFFDFVTSDRLHQMFLDGTYQMMVAVAQSTIIGVATLRNSTHLSLLFVEEQYHRQGVGRALLERMCDYLRREAGECYMSVMAAPYAVNFYKKLGFRAVEEEKTFSGIRVTPLEKFL